MAINKLVDSQNNVLFDLTYDTARSADVKSGKTFHDYSGVLVTGTATGISTNISDAKEGVLFLDYDGSPLYYYSTSDFSELETLPSLPDHTADNLTADGWNFTLQEISDRITELSEGDYPVKIIVAALYHTTDNLFYAYIKTTSNNKFAFFDSSSLRITYQTNPPFYLTIGDLYFSGDYYFDDQKLVSSNSSYIPCPALTEVGEYIDWGDGVIDTFTAESTEPISMCHQYNTAGYYTIKTNKTAITTTLGNNSCKSIFILASNSINSCCIGIKTASNQSEYPFFLSNYTFDITIKNPGGSVGSGETFVTSQPTAYMAISKPSALSTLVFYNNKNSEVSMGVCPFNMSINSSNIIIYPNNVYFSSNVPKRTTGTSTKVNSTGCAYFNPENITAADYTVSTWYPDIYVMYNIFSISKPVIDRYLFKNINDIKYRCNGNNFMTFIQDYINTYSASVSQNCKKVYYVNQSHNISTGGDRGGTEIYLANSGIYVGSYNYGNILHVGPNSDLTGSFNSYKDAKVYFEDGAYINQTTVNFGDNTNVILEDYDTTKTLPTLNATRFAKNSNTALKNKILTDWPNTSVIFY